MPDILTELLELPSSRSVVGISNRCIQRVYAFYPNGDPQRSKVCKSIIELTRDFAIGQKISPKKAKNIRDDARKGFDSVWEDNYWAKWGKSENRLNDDSVDPAQLAEDCCSRLSAEAAAKSFYDAAEAVVAATDRQVRRSNVCKSIYSCFVQARQSLGYWSEEDGKRFQNVTLEDIRDHKETAGAHKTSIWNGGNLQRDPWRGELPASIKLHALRPLCGDPMVGPLPIKPAGSISPEKILNDFARGMKIRRNCQFFPNVMFASIVGFLLSSNFCPGQEIWWSLGVGGTYAGTLVLAAWKEKEPTYAGIW